MEYHKKNELDTSSILLDSSLILTTILSQKATKTYNIKLVDCHDYTQIYIFENKKLLRQKGDQELSLTKSYEKDKRQFKIKNMFSAENTNTIRNNDSNSLKVVEKKNITRSKLECQRLAKCNIDSWKTFITLTFKDNVVDVNMANKKFRYFVDKIQRVKKDFKYICIPEFQKRGAIHYHLLTNLEHDSEFIPKRPKLNLYNPSSKTWKELEYYDIKYWNEGFSSAEIITGDTKKIIGYISKYMTKEIDNRLFNRHRYFFSRNLIKPTINYLDLSNPKHIKFYNEHLKDMNLVYKNQYMHELDKSNVLFLEFLKK